MTKLSQLEQLLREHELDHDVLSLFNFIKSAIEGREYAKFVFTRSLSNVIKIIQEIGAESGFDKNDLSYLNIQTVKELYASSKDIQPELKRSILDGQNAYTITKSLNLPPLITTVEDVTAFYIAKNEPNYVTLSSVSGQVVTEDSPRELLKNNIMFIPSADPGYDWIFSHSIGGLVTKYGGTNSHMAIRAGELGIPAVIGAGEALYETWLQANTLEINCAHRQVKLFQ